MDLSEYLEKRNFKPTPWARKNKISVAVISRLLNGKGISKENAFRISKATGGKVNIFDLLYPEKKIDRKVA